MNRGSIAHPKTSPLIQNEDRSEMEGSTRFYPCPSDRAKVIRADQGTRNEAKLPDKERQTVAWDQVLGECVELARETITFIMVTLRLPPRSHLQHQRSQGRCEGRLSRLKSERWPCQWLRDETIMLVDLCDLVEFENRIRKIATSRVSFVFPKQMSGMVCWFKWATY